MARILAVANQKGGVGKTTTVACLGAAYAEQGRRVLLVDLDPQACLTFSLGLDPDELERSVHDVLLKQATPEQTVIGCDDGVDLLPATIDLAGCEARLLTVTGREYRLKLAVDHLAPDYDDIIIDCPPTLGVLTINGLTAAQQLLIPLQCETLSHRGVGQLLDTVAADIQELTNPGLQVLGVLPTLFDSRMVHSREVVEAAAERYELTVLQPAIPRSVRFAEAPAVGRSILRTAKRSKGSEAYRQLASNLLPA